MIKNGVDGQLGLKITNKLNDYCIGIIGLYLSPDNFQYGQVPEAFFDNASVMWQDFTDCDLLIGAGDVNARTKDLLDYIPEIDGLIIPPRYNPDLTKNKHSNYFLSFLKDNQAIILNGRVTPQYNNFTFVNPRGHSVPDYIFCPIQHLSQCAESRTLLMTELVNMSGIRPPMHLPDHSMLVSTFQTSFFNNFINIHLKCPSNEQNNKFIFSQVHPRRKNIKKVDQSFMMSDSVHQNILQTINKLENIQNNQTELDNLWSEVKYIFLQEMPSLPNLPNCQNKKSNKGFRKSQAFWNQELSTLWQVLFQAENNYNSFKVKKK